MGPVTPPVRARSSSTAVIEHSLQNNKTALPNRFILSRPVGEISISTLQPRQWWPRSAPSMGSPAPARRQDIRMGEPGVTVMLLIMQSRRGLLGLLAGAVMDPDRLLWVPGKVVYSIPPLIRCTRLVDIVRTKAEYYGSFNPPCGTTLSALGQALMEIDRLGGEVLAIAPMQCQFEPLSNVVYKTAHVLARLPR
jgi:hypothetical protein